MKKVLCKIVINDSEEIHLEMNSENIGGLTVEQVRELSHEAGRVAAFCALALKGQVG